MRDEAHRVFGFIAFGLVIGLGILAALHMLVTLPVPNGKGAEWTASIGTVGALIGTIWLASAAERTRKREAHARAVVAAAGLMPKMSIVVGAVEWVIDALEDKLLEGYGHDYKSMHYVLAQAGVWSNEDILPLVALPRGTAANLAASRAWIEVSTELLKRSADDAQLTRQKIPGRAEMMLPYLKNVRASIAIAQEQCHLIL